jgi:ATP-dependent protease Clp ATPase subunit
MADEELVCNFCRRSNDEFDHLLTAPSVAVCDVCLGHLSTIMAKQRPEWGAALAERIATPKKRNH